MIMKLFAIRDSKTEAFLPPFMMHTIGEAERALVSHCNDAEHNFCKYAEDFNLFELGSWDNSTGVYSLHPAPVSIGLLVQYKRSIV